MKEIVDKAMGDAKRMFGEADSYLGRRARGKVLFDFERRWIKY